MRFFVINDFKLQKTYVYNSMPRQYRRRFPRVCNVNRTICLQGKGKE